VVIAMCRVIDGDHLLDYDPRWLDRRRATSGRIADTTRMQTMVIPRAWIVVVCKSVLDAHGTKARLRLLLVKIALTAQAP
jgi:hypothetical protein